MDRIEEVVIVGGGPAGTSCALELATQGKSPLIVDPSHPREKPCGGGISPRITQRFPFIEELRPMGHAFGTFKIISCTKLQFGTKEFENGFCIKRQYFDDWLLKLAIQKGAKLVSEKVMDVTQEGKLWSIQTTKKSFRARIVVGADGVNSLVRKRTVGPISTENLALTYGYQTTPVRDDLAAIKFMPEIPGYIWVFPGREHANIGIGSELRYGNKLRILLDNFMTSYCPQVMITGRYSAMVPSAKDPNFFSLPCSGQNWILVGDAAGHVDPISGGGILYALWGGKIAADAIARNHVELYEESWRREYGSRLIERCKNKDAYYDPLQSTMSIIAGFASGVFSWT